MSKSENMKVYAYIYAAVITCISGPHKDHPSPPGWSITSQLKLQDLRRLWRWEILSRFFCARKSYVICGFSMFQLGTTGDLRCFIYLHKELGVGATFSATSRGRASTVGVNHEKTAAPPKMRGESQWRREVLKNPLMAVKNWTHFVSTKRGGCWGCVTGGVSIIGGVGNDSMIREPLFHT